MCLCGSCGDRADARIEELSLRNQQRVQLAAPLVHRPELLILDQPFAGLDPIASDLLTDVLREEAARGVPVLFSSHQLELLLTRVRPRPLLTGKLLGIGALGVAQLALACVAALIAGPGGWGGRAPVGGAGSVRGSYGSGPRSSSAAR